MKLILVAIALMIAFAPIASAQLPGDLPVVDQEAECPNWTDSGSGRGTQVNLVDGTGTPADVADNACIRTTDDNSCPAPTTGDLPACSPPSLGGADCVAGGADPLWGPLCTITFTVGGAFGTVTAPTRLGEQDADQDGRPDVAIVTLPGPVSPLGCNEYPTADSTTCGGALLGTPYECIYWSTFCVCPPGTTAVGDGGVAFGDELCLGGVEVFVQLDYFFNDADPATNDELYGPSPTNFDYAVDGMLYDPTTGQLLHAQQFRFSDHFSHTADARYGAETYSLALYTPADSIPVSSLLPTPPARAFNGEAGLCVVCIKGTSITFGNGEFTEGRIQLNPPAGVDDYPHTWGFAPPTVLFLDLPRDTNHWGPAFPDGRGLGLDNIHIKLVPGPTVDPRLSDLDDDGDRDGEELACGSNPTNQKSTCIDLDGDDVGGVDPNGDPFTPGEFDVDQDGISDSNDNCPANANADQLNMDGDAQGDACDEDDDNDTFPDADETAAGSDPLNADSTPSDTDGDGEANADDNCPTVANTDQLDYDSDGLGNACDGDDDNDGKAGGDGCPFSELGWTTSASSDLDNDGCRDDTEDLDDDGDGKPDGTDSCPVGITGARTTGPSGNDVDNDGCQNTEDFDDDGDGVADATDNCDNHVNADQANLDDDAFGNACDADKDGDGAPAVGAPIIGSPSPDPAFGADCNDNDPTVGAPTAGYAATCPVDTALAGLPSPEDFIPSPEDVIAAGEAAIETVLTQLQDVFCSLGLFAPICPDNEELCDPAGEPASCVPSVGPIPSVGQLLNMALDPDCSLSNPAPPAKCSNDPLDQRDTRDTDGDLGKNEPNNQMDLIEERVLFTRPTTGVIDLYTVAAGTNLASPPAVNARIFVGNPLAEDGILFIFEDRGVSTLGPLGSVGAQVDGNSAETLGPIVCVHYDNATGANAPIVVGGGATVAQACADRTTVWKDVNRGGVTLGTNVYNQLGGAKLGPSALPLYVVNDADQNNVPDSITINLPDVTKCGPVVAGAGTRIHCTGYTSRTQEFAALPPLPGGPCDVLESLPICGPTCDPANPPSCAPAPDLTMLCPVLGDVLEEQCAEPAVPDADGDGVSDASDNCPAVANANQLNTDGAADGGNACDTDDDNDTVSDDVPDNCPVTANADQADADADGVGDVCEPVDTDSDSVPDSTDNCDNDANADQLNTDGAADGGDACDTDDDNDGKADGVDGCAVGEIAWTSSATTDLDDDGCRDAGEDTDDDADGDLDSADNCPVTANADQADANGDGIGDACDTDGDGDLNNVDNCPNDANSDQINSDGDALGNACDNDDDNDGVADGVDQCPTQGAPGPAQAGPVTSVVIGALKGCPNADGVDTPEPCSPPQIGLQPTCSPPPSLCPEGQIGVTAPACVDEPVPCAPGLVGPFAPVCVSPPVACLGTDPLSCVGDAADLLEAQLCAVAGMPEGQLPACLAGAPDEVVALACSLVASTCDTDGDGIPNAADRCAGADDLDGEACPLPNPVAIVFGIVGCAGTPPGAGPLSVCVLEDGGSITGPLGLPGLRIRLVNTVTISI